MRCPEPRMQPHPLPVFSLFSSDCHHFCPCTSANTPGMGWRRAGCLSIACLMSTLSEESLAARPLLIF